MKKWIAAMLMLVLMLEALPLTALAATAMGEPLTDAELAAAYALTGKNNGAGVYRSGMGVSASMNARQLYDWLDEQIGGDLYSAASKLANARVALEDARQDAPAAYEQLTRRAGWDDQMARMDEISDEMEDLRQTLRFQQDRLEENIVMVEEMGELKQEKGLFDYEVARCSAKIRAASQEISQIREYVVANNARWTADIALWKSIVDGSYGGASAVDAGINDCISAIYDTAEEPVTANTNVRVSGGVVTRASRLKGKGSVLANDTTTVTVMDGNHVYFEFLSPDGKPVPGIEVSVRDWVDPKEAKELPPVVTGTTKADGYVCFEISKFTVEEDTGILNLHVEANAKDVVLDGKHFRSFCLPRKQVARGKKHTTTLVEDDLKTPYIYEAAFSGYDIMYNDREILHSRANDEDFEITVKVAGKNVEPVLYYAKDDKGTDEVSNSGTFDRDRGVWVFKKKWKNTLDPENAKEIYFRFKGSGTKIQTKLKSIYSVFEEPTDLSALLNGIVPGVGFSFKIPWGGDSGYSSSIDFSIDGLDNLMPTFVADVTGNIYLAIGGIKNKWGGVTDKWKTNEVEDWERIKDGAVADSKVKKVFAQAGALYKDLKQKKYEGGAEGGFRTGVFALFTAKWNVAKDDPDTTYFSFTGSVGGALYYFVDFTFRFVTPGPIPIPGYICVTLTAGFTTAVEVGIDWVLKWDKDSKYWKVYSHKWSFHDFTIGFTIGAELTLGVGFKGLLSFWIRGGGSLNFTLNIFRNRPVEFIITGEASASAGFTFAIFTLSATIWSGEWQLYPKESANYLLEHYMPPARANDDAEHVDATAQQPQSYPDLAPKATVKMSGMKNTQGEVKVCQLGNDLYVFYIQDNRIRWKNISDDTGKAQGDIVDALKDGQKLYDGDIEVTDMKDYAFDVCVARGETQTPYHDLDCDDFFALVGVCADEYDDDGTPIDTTENVCVYAIYLWPDASGKLVCAMNGDGDGQLGFFRSAWAGSDYDDMPFVPCKPAIHAATYRMAIEEREGKFGMWLDDTGVDVELTELQNSESDEESSINRLGMAQSLQCDVDASHKSARKDTLKVDGNDDSSHSNEDVACGAGDDYVNVFAKSFTNGSWVSVTRSDDGDGDAGAIEFYDPIMDAAGEDQRKAIVLDKGRIDCYASVQVPLADGGTADLLFYTENLSREDDKRIWRLKGLSTIEKDRGEKTGDLKLQTTLSTYDITLPVSKFKAVTILDVVYLYWLAGGTQGKDGAKDTWRVNTVICDPVTNTISSPQVLAEFTMPDSDASIFDLFITEDGKGYLTAVELPKSSNGDGGVTEQGPLSVYEFQTALKPVLDLSAQVVEDLLVAPGDYDDVTVTVMNSGNMAATVLDVDVMLKESKGESVVATLHADCLHPENSSLTMDGKVIVQGEKAFYRLEDYDYTPRQNDWLLDEQNIEYVIEGGLLKSTNTDKKHTDYLKTGAVLPGSLGAFKGAFRIPEAWEDKSGSGQAKKDIELVLKSYSSNTNWVREIAAAGGRSSVSVLRSASNASTGRELTWVRDDDTGEMVLETQGLTVPHSRMISKRIDTPDRVTVRALHDLEVTGRVYDGPFGERMLEITVLDLAHTGETIHFYMQVYPDDGEDVYNISLDHRPSVVSDHMTHTFTMPLSEVLDPEAMQKARIVIVAEGVEEKTTSNNDVLLYLDGEYAPLTLLRQPRDVTIQEGESASFSVKVTGGVGPYSYQWQIWDSKHKKWVDIPGYNDSTMSREKVEKKWNGCRFRCVVTDRTGKSVISDAATLTVRDSVDTGDHSNLPLYLAVAFAALALFWWLGRRQRKPKV